MLCVVGRAARFSFVIIMRGHWAIHRLSLAALSDSVGFIVSTPERGNGVW